MGRSYVTMRREAFIEKSVQGGVAAACGHSTKHSTGRAGRLRFKGQTAAHSPPPAAHSPSRKSTPHYTIGYSTPAGGGRGFYTTERARAEEVLCTRRHWGALTGLWPRGGGLGVWAVAFWEEMAPGKVEARGLRTTGAQGESPIIG